MSEQKSKLNCSHATLLEHKDAGWMQWRCWGISDGCMYDSC